MSRYLPDPLRQRLAEADDGRCVYCQTAVENTGQPRLYGDDTTAVSISELLAAG